MRKLIKILKTVQFEYFKYDNVTYVTPALEIIHSYCDVTFRIAFWHWCVQLVFTIFSPVDYKDRIACMKNQTKA